MLKSVDELVVLAACTGCGKSHFIRELTDGRLDDMRKILALDPFDSYIVLDSFPQFSTKLTVFPQSCRERMIVCFAIPTIALNTGAISNLSEDRRIDLLKFARRVTVITLLASPATLRQRLKIRKRNNLKLLFRNVAKYKSERRRLKQLEAMYADPQKIIFAYDSWFNYYKSNGNVNAEWLMTAEDGYVLHNPNEWQRMREIYASTA